MAYNSIIKDGQIMAKWTDDQNRRLLAAMYLDYYRNVYRDMLGALIDEQVNAAGAKELKHYVESEGVTEKLINEIALTFAEPLGVEIPNKEKQTIEFNGILEKASFQIVLENINQYVELLRDCPVIPQVRNGKLFFAIITPEKVIVHQDPEDPTNYVRFLYQIGITENTPGKAERIDQYFCYDITSGKLKAYKCTLMATGEIDKDTIENVDKIPPYKEIPVVMFRDYLPDDSVWYKGNSQIVERAIAMDMRRTDLAMAEAYHIPQMVTIGMSGKDFANLTLDRTSFLNIPPNEATGESIGDAKYIAPPNDLESLDNLIKERIKRAALAKGLSADSIEGMTASSGFHLALSKSTIIDINKKKRKYYAAPVKKLLRLTAETLKYYKIQNFGDPEFNIDFGEIQFAQSEKDREEVWGLRLGNKTANLVDYELDENPDLKGDRKKALAIVLEREAENKQLRPANPFEDKEEEGDKNED